MKLQQNFEEINLTLLFEPLNSTLESNPLCGVTNLSNPCQIDTSSVRQAHSERSCRLNPDLRDLTACLGTGLCRFLICLRCACTLKWSLALLRSGQRLLAWAPSSQTELQWTQTGMFSNIWKQPLVIYGDHSTFIFLYQSNRQVDNHSTSFTLSKNDDFILCWCSTNTSDWILWRADAFKYLVKYRMMLCNKCKVPRDGYYDQLMGQTNTGPSHNVTRLFIFITLKSERTAVCTACDLKA